MAHSSQSNAKLRRALQSVKDKIQRAVSDRPELFEGIGDSTNDRLDHLLATVDNQTAQLDRLREQLNKCVPQTEHSATDHLVFVVTWHTKITSDWLWKKRSPHRRKN